MSRTLAAPVLRAIRAIEEFAMNVVISEGEGPVRWRRRGLKRRSKPWGVSLPDDYRAFLLKYNGGQVEPDGFAITWRPGQPEAMVGAASMVSWLFAVYDGRHENLLRMNQITFKGRLPPGTIAIGRDPGSNLLLCTTGSRCGEVLYWLMETEARTDDGKAPSEDNVGFVADSFDDFLQNRLH